MKARKNILASLALSWLCLGICTGAMAKTEIFIEYPYPELFDKVHSEIIEKFKEAEPDITVTVRSKYENYEDGTKKILRGAMTGSLPDVTFQGISRVRVMVEKGIAVPINVFIAREKDFAAKGFYDAMYETAMFDGKVYGLPFAVSQPISFFNMDLAEKAGYTEESLPKTWDEVYTFARKVEAGDGDAKGFFYYWGESGFWLLQALFFEEGGTFMDKDEKLVTINSQTGYWAFDKLREMVVKGNMKKDYDGPTAKADFFSGKLGLYIDTSSILYNVEQSVGDRFRIKTDFFPGLHDNSKLPVGGNVAVMTTTDPERQEAAWKFIRFWCGIEGAKTVATKTGYMAPNQNAVSALKDYFASNANAVTVYRHQPYMTGWYAFPGDNGLKITELINSAMEKTVTTDTDPHQIADDLNARVQKLVP